LNNPRVLELLKGYRLVRFDITASNAEQRALLDQYKLFGPPALMFFGKDGSEKSDQRVIGEINAADFAERVAIANDQI
ncbi:MAG: protein-disulfide reductase DsbD, partial [Pseudomonas sp.]|nr:protein-disulfide reductase DsbD [Pseudomonas sp.]